MGDITGGADKPVPPALGLCIAVLDGVLEVFQDLGFGGKAPRLQLGVECFAIHVDLESATGGGDQCDVGEVIAELG